MKLNIINKSHYFIYKKKSKYSHLIQDSITLLSKHNMHIKKKTHSNETLLFWLNKKVDSPVCKGGTRNFCLGGPSCSINIFIKTIPLHIYNVHMLFCYIHTHKYTLFYLISYIYTLTKKKKRKEKEHSIFNHNYIWWRSFIK